MTRITGALILVALLAAPALAQSEAKLAGDYRELEQKADESVELSLEGKLLEQGRKLLLLRKGVNRSVKELLGGLKGIYLKRFWFSKKKAYEASDVDPIHQELEGRGWVPMIDVKDREQGKVTVYSYYRDEEIEGVAVVSAEEQEVTVVNIVGDVDLETLTNLKGQLGIPNMDVPSMRLATRKLPGK